LVSPVPVYDQHGFNTSCSGYTIAPGPYHQYICPAGKKIPVQYGKYRRVCHMDVGNLQDTVRGEYCPDTGKGMTMSRSNWFLITSDEIEQIRNGLLAPWYGDAAGEARKQEILGIIDTVRNRLA
jgi:hypothetical protein